MMKDRVAIVTGGCRGIGRAITLRLVRQGWRCVIVGLEGDDWEGTVEEAGRPAESIAWSECDISTEHGRATLMRVWAGFADRLDLLVNCAARSTEMPMFEQDMDVWRAELETNVVAVALLSSWAIEQMRARRQGVVINVGSIYGLLGLNGRFYEGVYPQNHPRGPVRAPAYHASKGGVAAVTRELAIVAGQWNIRINTVSPGMIKTPERPISSQREIAFAGATPLRRMGTPRDIAAVVEFLASDEASFVTGAEWVVDGGWSIW